MGMADPVRPGVPARPYPAHHPPRPEVRPPLTTPTSCSCVLYHRRSFVMVEIHWSSTIALSSSLVCCLCNVCSAAAGATTFSSMAHKAS